MTRNLLITGGINHDFEDAASALADVLVPAGIESEITFDMRTAFEALATGNYELVTLYTLRWRMLDHEKYIPFREEWAYEISADDRNLLTNHIAEGGGLLGLHTTAICFDTWPEFIDLLGARWVWGTTFHPDPASFAVSPLNHIVTDNLPAFSVTDELYHNLQSGNNAVPLLKATSAEDGSDQTLAWANTYGKGRAVFSSLGHDRASLSQPDHALFLRNSANWCLHHEIN